MLSFIFLCLSLVILDCAVGLDQPSFRSSLNQDGKPILRLGPSTLEDKVPTENMNPHMATDASWVQHLKSAISNLVETYGYIGAKSQIARLVDDTEKLYNVLLRVEGDSTVAYKQTLRSAEPAPTPPPPPQWETDFKNFAKTLMERYPIEQVKDYMEPVLRYVQRHHHVIIKDIDVDEYGEIIMTWVPDSKHNVKYT